MIVLTALAIAAGPSGERCGGSVVGAQGETLQLTAKDHTVTELPANKGVLAASLPIVACDGTQLLVRYQGALYVVPTWQAVVEQKMRIVCVADPGQPSGTSNTHVMNAIDPRDCIKAKTEEPAPKAPAKSKKK